MKAATKSRVYPTEKNLKKAKTWGKIRLLICIIMVHMINQHNTQKIWIIFIARAETHIWYVILKIYCFYYWLSPSRPALDHWQGENVTHLMSIVAHYVNLVNWYWEYTGDKTYSSPSQGLKFLNYLKNIE